MRCKKYAASVLSILLSTAAIVTSSIEARADGNWTGFNVGVGIAGTWLDSSTDIGYFRDRGAGPVTDQVSVDGDGSSASGFVRLGYDRQMSSGFLIGVFVDHDFGRDISKNFSDNTLAIGNGAVPAFFSTSGSIEFDDSTNLGVRLGFLVNPQMLLYATGGYSRIKVRGSATMVNVAGNTEMFLSFNDHLNGYFVGAGAEYEITDNLAISLEYRYSGYSGESYSVDGNLLNAAGRNRAITANVDDTNLQVARIGLILKLNQDD